MTFSYTGDPSLSAKDLCRFTLGDTDPRNQILQDAEIQWALNQYTGAAMNACIRLCEMVTAKFSRQADESVGSVSVSYSQRAKSFRSLRKDLVRRLATEDMTPYCGGISVSDKKNVVMTGDRLPTDFHIHMMENSQLSPWVTGSLIGDYMPLFGVL